MQRAMNQIFISNNTLLEHKTICYEVECLYNINARELVIETKSLSDQTPGNP